MAHPPDDEWFRPADPSLSPGERRPPAEDEWLVDDSLPRSTPFDPWSLANQRVLVPTGIAVVFLVALLAAFGVFSSGSPQTPAPILTTATPPVTSTTTTPPVQRTTLTPPTTTLKPGDTGAQVMALQRELASLGYSVRTIDGDYGPATTTEVTAFQRAHRLTPDGIVGPATLLALAP